MLLHLAKTHSGSTDVHNHKHEISGSGLSLDSHRSNPVYSTDVFGEPWRQAPVRRPDEEEQLQQTHQTRRQQHRQTHRQALSQTVAAHWRGEY